MRLPLQPGDPATVAVARSHRGRPDLKVQWMADLASGEIRADEKFGDAPRGKQWRFWVRWLHTGESGGIWGQTLSLIAVCGALLLVWTGFALAWRRLRRAMRP